MEMSDYKLLPGSVMYASLFGGCAEKGDLNEAKSVLSCFGREFQIYDSKSYNAFVEIYCEEGE